jgi:Ni,Fe-hydrogenase III small subunit/NAD-dependent dihydropyrimidine dehydrogenase PreA subunit
MKFIIDRMIHGKETVRNALYDNPYSYGKIEVNSSCNGCRKCTEICSVKAIQMKEKKAFVDYKKCIYCRNCIIECEIGAMNMTSNYKMASIEEEGQHLKEKVYSKFNRSLVLRSVDTGSCNGCMLELSAMQNTYYALSQFGVNFAASPRHADGIIVTGPVTLNMKDALIKTYKAMSEPRLVIAVGACAYDGGIFKDGYGSFKELMKIIPVDLAIPGCPPSPQAMIYGLLKLMDRI